MRKQTPSRSGPIRLTYAGKASQPGGSLSPEAMIQRGIKLHNQRRFREAEYCYQLVLRGDPANADALNLMGLLAVEADRLPVAIDFLEKAVNRGRKVAIYRNNLGNAYLMSGKPKQAIGHLKKAVSFNPGYADAMCNLGRAEMMLSDASQARHWFGEALKATPGFARAQIGLAELDIGIGKLDNAVDSLRAALKTDPGNIEALCALAQARRFAEDDPDFALLKKRLGDRSLRADQSALLHHAFAKVCNDVERWDDAMSHFQEGKKLKRLEFDIALHRKRYAHLRTFFPKSLFAGKSDQGNADERPVFIVGMPRTGTTLCEQILASHPQVHGLGELPDMRRVAASLGFSAGGLQSFGEKISTLSGRDIRQLADRFLDALNPSPNTALRATDKNPHNYELLGLIALLLPKARIIHCRRDPLDTCVACYMQNFNAGHGYVGDLKTLGEYYCEYHQLMQHWREVLPLPMFEVDYESLVSDMEKTSRALVSFLDLPWDDRCLRYHETERLVATPSRWQVRQTVYKSSIGRWKRYDHHLGPLKDALEKVLSEA